MGGPTHPRPMISNQERGHGDEAAHRVFEDGIADAEASVLVEAGADHIARRQNSTEQGRNGRDEQ